MKKMKRLNKKGFSIVEVIIAMTVIAIVSASALTIVLKSLDNTRAAMYKADAQYLVYDALECFKVSETWQEFDDAFFQFRGKDYMSRITPTLLASEEQDSDEGEADSEDTGDSGDNGALPPVTAIYLQYMINDSKYTVEVIMVYGAPVYVGGELRHYTHDTFQIKVYNSENEVASITNYYKISKGESE